MKIVKKSLLVATTLALGLAMTGCKKNTLLKDINVSKLSTNDVSYKNLNQVFNQSVKDYVVRDSFITYITENDETVFYNYILEKELFRTTEEIDYITTYNHGKVLYIRYDDTDRTEEYRTIDGDVLVERGKYFLLSDISIKSEYPSKADAYYEETFKLKSKKVGEEVVTKYYKLTTKAAKNADKRLVETGEFTLTEIAEKDAQIYNDGDDYLVDGESYSYNITSDGVIFYNYDSHKATLTLEKDNATTAKVFMFKEKAIVQLIKNVNGMGKYNLFYNNNYYLIDTFTCDAKKGTYERLENFDYYIGNVNSSAKLSHQLLLYNAGLIVDNKVVAYNDICLNSCFKVIQDDQMMFYATYCTDLGNGNYIASSGTNVLLTNSDGKIKKVFNGNYRILPGGKVILIYNNGKMTFIDYNGNYIVDDVYSVTDYEVIDYNTLFYINALDSTYHVIKFEKAKILSDEEVDYKVLGAGGFDSYTELNTMARYLEQSNFYYTAKYNDDNGDLTFDNASLTFYSIDDTEIGKINSITELDFRYQTDKDGVSSIFYFAAKETDYGYVFAIYQLN